jgi:hypothetical protein
MVNPLTLGSAPASSTGALAFYRSIRHKTVMDKELLRVFIEISVALNSDRSEAFIDP